MGARRDFGGEAINHPSWANIESEFAMYFLFQHSYNIKTQNNHFFEKKMIEAYLRFSFLKWSRCEKSNTVQTRFKHGAKHGAKQKNLKRAIARVDCFTFAYFAQISGSFDLLNALR